MKSLCFAFAGLFALGSYASDIGVVQRDGSVYQAYLENGQVVVAKCRQYTVLEEGRQCASDQKRVFESKERFLQIATSLLVNSGEIYDPEVAEQVRQLRQMKSDSAETEALQKRMVEIENYAQAYNQPELLGSEEYVQAKKTVEDYQLAMSGFEGLKSNLENVYQQIAGDGLVLVQEENNLFLNGLVQHLHTYGQHFRVNEPMFAMKHGQKTLHSFDTSKERIINLLSQKCEVEHGTGYFQGNIYFKKDGEVIYKTIDNTIYGEAKRLPGGRYNNIGLNGGHLHENLIELFEEGSPCHDPTDSGAHYITGMFPLEMFVDPLAIQQEQQDLVQEEFPKANIDDSPRDSEKESLFKRILKAPVRGVKAIFN